ncbi:AAA family ATPase [Streptomyces sp. Q6]|uniref:AAA family ATPase n=1 Tax=Streptomyces citrinus TaxID=3118173 RepID=A0ACD5AL32_9ACTN
MSDTAPAAPFVTRVRIENFKSIASCDVSLGAFNVLLGLNAAGKSNFLDALRFVRDALASGLGPAVDARGGLLNVLRRDPEPADLCRITVGVRLPASAVPGRQASGTLAYLDGTYSFDIGYGPEPSGPEDGVQEELFVHTEDCELTAPDGSRAARFSRTAEFVRDSEFPSSPNMNGVTGLVETDSLYLPSAGTRPVYAALHRGLAGMFFYDPALAALREPRPLTTNALMSEDGGNLGATLSQLDPVVRRRIDAYMAAIVPGLTSVEPSPTSGAGDYVAAQMTLAPAAGQPSRTFRAESMSDGTIRAIGLLAALFQPRARDGRIRLVAVEEPELGLHPMAAGALYDALTEASNHVQVLGTSQSSQLFDRKEADLDAVKMVASQDGATVIGPLDGISRGIITDGLSTIEDLLRSDQLEPELTSDAQESGGGRDE